MKKLLCICLSMLLLFIVGISAYAFGPEEAQFRSTEFTCVKGNGDFLSYGFDNTADADCMVELYKKGLIWDTKVSSMTVRPHDPGGKTEVIRNPSDSTFYFVLYAADGGTICGHLQAYQ